MTRRRGWLEDLSLRPFIRAASQTDSSGLQHFMDPCSQSVTASCWGCDALRPVGLWSETSAPSSAIEALHGPARQGSLALTTALRRTHCVSMRG